MAMHLGDYMGRKISIETAQRDDGKYYVRSVQVEVLADDQVLIDEMPYLGMAHADECEVVAVATLDATEYVKSRF